MAASAFSSHIRAQSAWMKRTWLLGMDCTFISKLYFHLWKTSEVSERMWSVNLEASILAEYRTLGGHSGRPSQSLGSLITGTGVTGISDDWYRSNWDLWWLVQEYHGSECDKFGNMSEHRRELGCTWNCRRNNAEITNNFWEMSRFVMGFIRRTVGVIWDSPEVHEQSISLNGEYDAWIIVHYQFWIILATIFFNTVFIASLHYCTKEKGKWFKHKRRHTETITGQNSQPISIKHGVGVIHYFSHLIWGNECRNA